MAANTVTVYASGSFASKGSLGAWIQASLAKKGLNTQWVSFGSAGEALNQIALEGKKTRADLVVGIDNGLLPRAREIGLFDPIPKEIWSRVPAELQFDSEHRIVPFDYGYVAILYDSRRTQVPEKISLRDFSRDARFAKRLAIQDPRTSSLGLSFLLWTVALFGEGQFGSFWGDLAKQTLSVSPSWSGAYGLFLKGEVDFVVSYTTSPAYHLEKENNPAIRAIAFPEGHYRQIEGVSLVRYSSRRAQARKWVEFLLSDEVQAKLPSLQWMYPAVAAVPLPASFAQLKVPDKVVSVDPAKLRASRKGWLKEWTAVMVRKP